MPASNVIKSASGRRVLEPAGSSGAFHVLLLEGGSMSVMETARYSPQNSWSKAEELCSSVHLNQKRRW